MTRYAERGFCSLCGEWIERKKLRKLFLPKLKVYAYYCPKHNRQVRLKARSSPMAKVPLQREGSN